MKNLVARIFLPVLVVLLQACGGQLQVKVDIADPSRIAAIRASGGFRTMCYLLASESDAQINAEVMPVIEEVTSAAKTFREASLRHVEAAKLGTIARDIVMAMPGTREDVEGTFEAKQHVVSLQSARAAIAADTQGCIDRSPAMEQRIAERDRLHQAFLAKVRQGLADLKSATTNILRTPAKGAAPAADKAAPTSDEKKVEAAAATAQAAIALCRNVICGGGLSGSVDAYGVASLPELAWGAVFNRAIAEGTNGNVDIVIKMNQQADFTVKGMRFDVSKIPEVARKAATQALLLAAEISGVPATRALSTGSTENKAFYAAGQSYGTALQKQDQREALIAARHDALLNLAITIAASQVQMQSAAGRDQLKAAVTARETGADGLLRLSDYPN